MQTLQLLILSPKPILFIMPVKLSLYRVLSYVDTRWWWLVKLWSRHFDPTKRTAVTYKWKKWWTQRQSGYFGEENENFFFLMGLKTRVFARSSLMTVTVSIRVLSVYKPYFKIIYIYIYTYTYTHYFEFKASSNLRRTQILKRYHKKKVCK